MRPRPRPALMALAAVLVYAAAVRAVFWFQIAGSELAAVPVLDSLTYHEWALALASGDWGWHETYWMGPLYPHLLALTYKLFGPRIPVALALQLALSWFNVLLTWRLARRALAGGEASPRDARRGEWTAVAATALYAAYGAPVFYDGNLLMATLATTLLLLAAGRALTAVGDPTPRRWFLAGLTIGLAGLCRGNVLLLLGVLPALLWLPGHARAAARARRAKRTRLAGAMLAGGLLMLVPPTVRNLVVAHDFVLLTSNGGINLLIGQMPGNDGMFAPVADEPDAEYDPSMEINLEFEEGRDLKGSEVSRILTRRAWRQFRDHLSQMPLLYLQKAYRFWNGYELPQIVSYDYWRTQFGALRWMPLPYLLLSALGLLGLRFLPPPARGVVAAVLVGYFLSLWPFFPTSRYRQPLAPLLAVSAAAFVWAMVSGAGRRRVWLTAAVLLTVALLPRWARLAPDEVLWQVRIHQASRAGRLHDMTTLLRRAREADQVLPGRADTPFLLGLYLEKMGAYEEAVAALRQAEARVPDNRLVPYYIGRNLDELGRLDEALAALDRAIARDPQWGYPWHRRALILAEQGDQAGALAAMERAYELSPGNQRVRANLAAMYAEAGRFADALPLLESLTRDYPRYVNGWFNLALARHQTGDDAGARAALDAALRIPRLKAGQIEQIDRLRSLLDPQPADRATG